MAENNEKPIDFNDDMIRAILRGEKTQTRRLMKPQPLWVHKRRHGNYVALSANEPRRMSYTLLCPYGKPNDRLWVREAYKFVESQCEGINRLTVAYRASGVDSDFTSSIEWREPDDMPRWASRIILRIKAVWVEKLQSITYNAAIAEGVSSSKPVRAFRNLWTKIYDTGAWKQNPWVWVIEFEYEKQENKNEERK